ncbi:MAG: S9 family peptidase, partial [Bacteroidota bacterium]
YRWLEDDDSKETKAWVDAQNEVTFDYLAQIPFRDKIRERMEKLWNYPRFSAPFQEGNHYFFYKNDGLQNQAVLYRMNGLEGEPAVFLDPNGFSDDGTASLTTFEVSHDGKYAAYGVSKGGSDWNEYFVKNVETGEMLEDHLKWIKFSGAAWYGEGFFYGRFAEPTDGSALSGQNEHKKIYYHKIGDAQSSDNLVYEEPEHPRRGIYASTTRDERFLLIYLTEGATNDNALKVRDLRAKGERYVEIATDFANSYWVIDNLDDHLLVLTNDGAPRKRVVSIDVNKPDRKHWKEVIPEREEVLDGVSYVGGKLYARYLKDASSMIAIHAVDGKPMGTLELPGIGTVSGISGKKDQKMAFYTFTSFTYPSSTFQLDTETGKSTLFRKSGVDFDPEAFVTKQVFYKSKDGTRVSMFVVHKKGLKLDGNNPCLLYGYGGFNINILPAFSVNNLVLLENGGIYAVANLRGGGEYG